MISSIKSLVLRKIVIYDRVDKERERERSDSVNIHEYIVYASNPPTATQLTRKVVHCHTILNVTAMKIIDSYRGPILA